jgi:gliding motility-associated-like protein
MKKYLLSLLLIVITAANSFAQGGNSCAAAQANPSALPFNYTGQSTCSSTNSYTGTNGCLSTTYYTANNWYYYFCATQNGYVTINVPVTTSTLAAYPSVSVFSGCPTSGGQCLAAAYAYAPANTTTTVSVTVQVNANQCYFVVIDGYYFASSYAQCFNFSVNSTFTPIPVQAGCTNMNFEAGNLTGWFCTTGQSVTGCTTCPTPTYNQTAIGVVAGRHTIMTGGNDPCGGFPCVAPGGSFSARLGNNSTGAQGERMSQTFTVSAANASFTYKYAVVLQDPSHQPYQQPFFQAIMRDGSGNIIPCSQFIVSAAANLSGFFNSTSCASVRYKPWTTVNVDLTGYIGQNVTIEFTTGDCSAGAHYGYAYIDCECAPSLLQANNDTICQGQCATLSAPVGYQSYSWAPVNNTTTSITVCPTATTIYTLTLTAFNGCTTQNRDTIWVMANPTANFTVSAPQCNTPITITNNSSVALPSTITNWNWTFPGGSPSSSTAQNPSNITYSTPGTYTITLVVTTQAGCTATFTQTIVIPPCNPQVVVSGGSVCTGGCMTLTATPSSGNPPYSFVWSPNIGTTSSVQACPTATTIYTVTITDAQNQTATDTVQVIVMPPININMTSTTVLCFSGTASATATPTNGNAPYTYLWNNAQTTQTATGLVAGTYSVTVTDATGCTGTATITITQPPQLTVSATSTNVSCFGGNDGTGTATANGGATPYNYNWAPSGGNAATATGLTAVTYTVTVTDANGCTATATITVTEPTLLIASVAGFDATCFGACNGQAVTIPSGGTTPYAYSWAPLGGNAPSAVNLCAGSYTVFITDANGCTFSGTATVNEPPALVLGYTAVTASCMQADGSANVTASGGTPTYAYAWNPNVSTTNSANNIFPGTYTVTVTDANGCSDTIHVVVPNQPGVVASITAFTNVTCFGFCDGFATASAINGTAPYTYNWTPSGGTSTTATGLCAGTYTFTVTDATGCIDTAIVNITEPQQLVVQPGPGVTICIGQCTTLTATASGGTPAYTYSWAPAGPSNVCPTVTTTYTVYVTDANNCPSNPQTVTVTVAPPLGVTAAANPAIICIGSSTQVSATSSGGNGGPYNYSWSPGNATTQAVTVSPTATTTYTVWVTDGCGTPTDTATVTVVVNPLPIITFYSSDSSGCAPLCVDFFDTTPNGAQWAWTFNGASPSMSSSQNPTNICYLLSGSYDVSLTVTDNNGCSSTATVLNMITVYPSPIADFGMTPTTTTILNPIICFNDLSQSASSWTWNFGDPTDINNASNDQNPCHTYSDTGRYCVNLTVASQFGCVDTVTYCLIIEPDFAIYVPNAFTHENGDGNNDTFFPQGIGIDKDKFEMWIYDRWGNMIWYNQVWGKGWDGRANGGSDIAQQDVYVWKINLYDVFGKKHSLIGHVTLVK